MNTEQTTKNALTEIKPVLAESISYPESEWDSVSLSIPLIQAQKVKESHFLYHVELKDYIDTRDGFVSIHIAGWKKNLNELFKYVSSVAI
jgi:hypothetical protein